MDFCHGYYGLIHNRIKNHTYDSYEYIVALRARPAHRFSSWYSKVLLCPCQAALFCCCNFFACLALHLLRSPEGTAPGRTLLGLRLFLFFSSFFFDFEPRRCGEWHSLFLAELCYEMPRLVYDASRFIFFTHLLGHCDLYFRPPTSRRYFLHCFFWIVEYGWLGLSER